MGERRAVRAPPSACHNAPARAVHTAGLFSLFLLLSLPLLPFCRPLGSHRGLPGSCFGRLSVCACVCVCVSCFYRGQPPPPPPTHPLPADGAC